MESHKKTMFNMRSFYFLSFFGLGGLFPLLSVYLQNDIGLTGSQIGMIMSIGPIVMLISQPLWGILSDVTNKPRILLTITVIFTGVIGFLYIFPQQYLMFAIIAAGLAFFQSAIVPLSDSMTISYVHERKEDYGRVRLWGAAGFAVSVWIVGNLSDSFGLSIIFYSFLVSMVLSGWFALGMPKESNVQRVEWKTNLWKLIKIPRFLLFLVATFLVFGPIMANNFYFGLLIQFTGGSLAGVGFAFLLAAGSEIPFMRWAGDWIEKRGVVMILFVASIVSGLRWIFYSLSPAPMLIYVTTVIQGFSIGLFVPAALQYVSNLASKEIKATAISIYSAVGNGLGAWFFTYTAGVIMEWYSILSVYLFYGVLTLTGAAVVFIILVQDRQQLRGIS